MTDVFTQAQVDEFLTGCAKISNVGLEDMDPMFKVSMTAEPGRRYCRVVRACGPSRSAHCFIDMSNGDILLPDGWKRPAKHARGNLNDAQKGLGNMGPFGPAYLR